MLRIRWTRQRAAVFAVVGVVVLAAAWVLGSPLFIDKTVDEAFPGVPTPAALAAMPAAEKERMAEAVLAAAREMPSHQMTETMPEETATPALLSSGRFADADAIHRGSGSAGIYQLPTGSHLLRLEDLDVTNGPDLRIILVKHGDPQASGDVGDDYLDLGPLKGNIGNQNYEIPEDAELSEYASVAVWCRAFGVLFSAAPLQALS